MELFEPVEGAFDEGGLMDEGGTVDPESGNDVPVGSTQEEVRDDIPAQLSEGEFVLPADVVRYIGLEKIMALRDEAKAGLARMEAMGQMGNSEEATIPDGVPFDINDLDMEDDGMLEYQVGGFVQPQGFTGISGVQQSQFANYQPQFTPYTPAPFPTGQQFAQQYTAPTQQFTPTLNQQAPTFEQITGTTGPSPGGYDTLETYVNDAGMEMQIPFKDGNPIYPIPEGYKKKTQAVDTTTDVQTTTTQTTARQQDSGDDGPSTPQYSTTDTTGVGYDRGKIENEALLDVLNKSAIAQAKDVGPVVGGMFTGSATGVLGQVGKEAGRELGLISGKTQHAGAVLGGVIDEFRDPTKQVNYVTGKKSGSYANTTPLHQLSNTQQQMLADTFYSVNQKMNSIYEKEKIGKDGKSSFVTKSSAEIKQSLIDTVKELGLDKTVFTDKNNKTMTDADLSKLRQETLEREIARAYAREVGQERRTAAEQLASQYGISAANKTIEEINAEVNKAKADAEASARREAAYLESVGGYSQDDDGGMGGFTVQGPGGTTYTTDSSGTSGAFTGGPTGMEDEYDFNKGGLAQQMKRSGLASKK